MKCPIKYYEKNLIFNDNDYCWAGFKMEGVNFAYLGEEAKLGILGNLAKLVGSFIAIKIYIVPTDSNITQHINLLKKSIPKDNPAKIEAVKFLEKQEEYLKEKNLGGNDTTYILIKLIDEADGDPLKITQKAITDFLKQPIKSFTDFMTMQPGDIPEYKYKHYKALEARYMRDLSMRFNVSRIQAGEMQWLLKRTFYRGLKKSAPYNKTTKRIVDDGEVSEIYTTDWNPKADIRGRFVRPLKRDIINMFSGEIKQAKRHIEVIHGDGNISYQTFLNMVHIPDVITFPGTEWIYMLQLLPMPVEVCITIDNLEHRKAKSEIGKKRIELNSQLEEATKSGSDIDDDLFASKEQTDALESELKDQHLPLCSTSVTFCLASDNLEQLEINTEYLKTFYGDQNFIIERSISDQMKLFMQSLMGTEKYVTAYDLKLSPLTLASGVFGVNNKLGDDRGYYIGVHGLRDQPCFLDLEEACLKNQSPAGTIYGNLGSGKSFNANLLIFLHVLFKAKSLIFDPKSERGNWITNLPILAPYVRIITIDTSDEHKGKMDPFNIYKDDLDAAVEKAQSVLCEILNISVDSIEFTIITEALQSVKGDTTQNASMEAVIKMLEKWKSDDALHDVAKVLSRRLDGLRKIGLTKLIFGNGTEKSISFDSKINILQINGLKIPDPKKEREDYSIPEIISGVIMGTFGDFAVQFIKRVKGFKVVAIDESWFIKKLSAGQEMIDNISRMGRSLSACLLLLGHSVLDLPSEESKNTIKYKFCFKTDSTDEARRMLAYMSLETTPENIATIKGLNNRQCMFQDLYGRVGVLTFDAVFDELIEVFSTTPEDSMETNTYETVEAIKVQQVINKDAKENEATEDDYFASEDQGEEVELNNVTKDVYAIDPKKLEYLKKFIEK